MRLQRKRGYREHDIKDIEKSLEFLNKNARSKEESMATSEQKNKNKL